MLEMTQPRSLRTGTAARHDLQDRQRLWQVLNLGGDVLGFVSHPLTTRCTRLLRSYLIPQGLVRKKNLQYHNG